MSKAKRKSEKQKEENMSDGYFTHKPNRIINAKTEWEYLIQKL